MLGQEALLRHGVEAAEEAEAGICDEGHDMALALDRPQLEGDGGAQGVLCGDHFGTGQLGGVGEAVYSQADHVGNEQEEAAEAGGELAWLQGEAATIGDGFDGGPNLVWPLVITASRQAGEAFVLQDLADSGGAERRSLLLERTADVVDRVVALAQGNDLGPAAALVGLRLGALAGGGEEVGQAAVSELVTEDMDGTGRVAEAAGDFGGRQLVDEEGAQGFVLTLAGRAGLGEEAAGVA